MDKYKEKSNKLRKKYEKREKWNEIRNKDEENVTKGINFGKKKEESLKLWKKDGKKFSIFGKDGKNCRKSGGKIFRKEFTLEEDEKKGKKKENEDEVEFGNKWKKTG